MIDKKALEGMRKASPEKRYKNFLNTVTDLEKVWLLSSKDGCVTFDVDGFVHVMLWPRKEFCEFLMTLGETPISMEIHDFLAQCKTLDESIRFMVFPTEKDAFVVTGTQLCSDLEQHLREVE